MLLGYNSTLRILAVEGFKKPVDIANQYLQTPIPGRGLVFEISTTGLKTCVLKQQRQPLRPLLHDIVKKLIFLGVELPRSSTKKC